MVHDEPSYRDAQRRSSGAASRSEAVAWNCLLDDTRFRLLPLCLDKILSDWHQQTTLNCDGLELRGTYEPSSTRSVLLGVVQRRRSGAARAERSEASDVAWSALLAAVWSMLAALLGH